MCRWPSADGGTIENVSSSARSSRSGSSSAAPSASRPRWAASTTTNERPRTISATSWPVPKRMIRATDVISGGAVAVHSSQACSTSAARLGGEEQRARVEVVGWVEVDLERGDHAAARAARRHAPARRPGSRTRPSRTPAAASPCRRASHPMPSPSTVPTTLAPLAKPAGRRKAEERGRPGDVGPPGAGADAGAVGARIDLDADQPRGAHEHRVLERTEPRRRPAAALGDDAQVRAGPPRARPPPPGARRWGGR